MDSGNAIGKTPGTPGAASSAVILNFVPKPRAVAQTEPPAHAFDAASQRLDRALALLSDSLREQRVAFSQFKAEVQRLGAQTASISGNMERLQRELKKAGAEVQRANSQSTHLQGLMEQAEATFAAKA